MTAGARLVRGTVLHYLDDPGEAPDPRTWELFEDGVLAVDARGRVAWAGDLARLPEGLRRDAEWIDHRGSLIVPGFVDTHVHASQVDCIASYGEQLLPWLETYVFPAEARLADTSVARAEQQTRELNGRWRGHGRLGYSLTVPSQ